MKPKSQIKSILNQKFTVKDLDQKSLVVIGNNVRKNMQDAVDLFEQIPELSYTFEDKSKKSSLGRLVVDKTEVYFRPRNIVFRQPNIGPQENDSIKNRLSFAHLIYQVSSQTTLPFTIVLDSGNRVVIDDVRSTKFLGKSIADFRLLRGSTPMRVTVNLPDGVYHTQIQDMSVLHYAHDALTKAVENQVLNATIDDNNYMTLNQPVAVRADQNTIRLLILDHIRGGVGVMGRFDKNSATFDGMTNILKLKCHKVFKSGTDISSGDHPWVVISNSSTESLFDLRGLTVDLVPKKTLPRNTTIINI